MLKNINIHIALLLRLGFALFLFFLCRVVFYWYNKGFYLDVSSETLYNIFKGGLRFDIAGLGYLLGFYILTQVIPFKFRHHYLYQKITSIFYILPLYLGIFMNLGDVAYYEITLKRTTISIFKQFSNETNMMVLFSQFLLDYWYLFLLLFGLFYIIFIFNKKIKIAPPKTQNNLIYTFSSLMTSLLIVGVTVIGIRGGYGKGTRPIAPSNAAKYVDKPNQVAIVLNTPFAFFRTIEKSTLSEVNYFENQAEQEAIYSAHQVSDLTKGSLFKKKNVVLFIIESFGREHIGALNRDIPNYKGYTPFIDSLIRYSYAFKHSFSNGRKSISGMPSCLASIPSLVEPFILSHYSSNTINSLASLLKAEGYQTAFFHGAPNGSMGFDSFAKQAGFEAYFGQDEYGAGDRDGYWGIWDEEFFQYYAEEMDKMKPPFCTALFSLTSHHPFVIPDRYEGIFPEGPLKIQRPIGYTDNALRQFFKTASEMSWFENTLFIITADHASTFGYLDKYKTATGFFGVPFIVYDPSDTRMKSVDTTTVVQQIDIMPTVLGLLNYPKEYIAFGKDVLNSEEEHFAIGYMSDNYHLFKDGNLLQYDGETVTGFYNFIKDPLYKNNLKSEDHAKKTELLRFCQAFIQEYNRRMIKNEMTLSD